jgi:hypothetical protein
LGPGLFLGYISATPISSLSFSTFPQSTIGEVQGWLIVDNVRLGVPVTAPEPSTLALLLMGVGSLVVRQVACKTERK